ncbi:MAG TPA: hypothetical protein PLX85_03855 [Dehalococcoidia bacterium]|nr:hypothetical protein [Dehalococcoidia bacterium]
MRLPFARRQGSEASAGDRLHPRVLILTPMKDARPTLDNYVRLLRRLTYPHDRISLGFLEGDSADGTFEALRVVQPQLDREFRRALIWKRDFGYRIPDGLPRWDESIQFERRSILARSRNHLLFHALDDEDWVLWMDADLLDYPADVIERLLAVGKDIVHPHCVLQFGGPTFDQNAWVDQGQDHMDVLRDHELVRLDAVGGTMLLVNADLHRDGLVFPPFMYGLESPRVRRGRGEIETEGLAALAHDMGVECWGLPNLEILHHPF